MIHNLTISNVGSANSDNIIVANGSQLLLSGTLTITLANDADAQLTTNSNIFASGTITVNSSAVLAITGGTLTLNDKGDQTINLNGKRIFSLEIDNGGSANDDSVFVANGSQLLLSGALTVTNGTLNLMDNTEAMIVRRNITLANDADAIIASNSTIIASGSISTGASASWAITGATITLNGNTRRQAIDFDNTKVMAFTMTNTSSGVLTSNLTVLGTLTVNTGSTIALGANTLYATGSAIVNYGKIYEDTGKIYHTGSNFVVGNSSYSRIDLFREGDSVYFTMKDSDENIDGTVADTLTIAVTLARDGTVVDTETVTLTETGKETGIFRGSVTTKNQAASSENGYLDYTKDASISAIYTDAQDGLKNSQGATFQVLGTSGSSGSGGGGGGGRRVGASAPVQGPKKTPPPARRIMKQTVKEKRLEQAKKKEVTVKKQEAVKKALKTKAQEGAEDEGATAEGPYGQEKGSPGCTKIAEEEVVLERKRAPSGTGLFLLCHPERSRMATFNVYGSSTLTMTHWHYSEVP
ncbi:hypothetical protein HYT95_02740 [Candidatus Peregrinibacteria bacterium]|nr:hypothetical protein [Candidatus Peregrinibacteria bacterium]